MEALFAPDCALVGWIDPGRAIFDTEMRYVAYISGINAWSVSTGAWLGPVDNFTLCDRRGKPMAWNPSHPIRGQLTTPTSVTPLTPLQPLTPLRPLNPPTPLRPLTPLGGWSPMSFGD